MKRPLSAAFLLLATVASPLAHADAVARLKAFNTNTQSLTAEFSQRVLDERLREVQKNTGYLAIQRPGRFRWVYKTPHEQLLVSDGKTLWMYDPELKQVTKRSIGGAMSGSPAALLAGDGALEKSYKLSSIGNQDGLDWLEAKPRRDDSGFVRIRIGMSNDDVPAAMELTDTFGQTTLLRFTKVQRNPRILPEAFQFSVPSDTDVLTE